MTTKIYPSSSAFMVGPLVASTGNKSCHRYLAAVHHSGLSKEQLATVIAPEYQAMGALDEWLYATKLDKQGVTYEREVPFKLEFSSAVVSGRMDFVLEDGTVVEKKSTTSKNVYRRVFDGNTPEPSHISQLVSYLAFLNKNKGRLVVSYYELGPDLNSFQLVEEKVFTVETHDQSVITVNGQIYNHSVKDLARWYSLVEKKLSADTTQEPIGPAPRQASKYESACFFCPLNGVCKQVGDGTTIAEFTELARPALLVKPEMRKFTMQTNTDRRKKNREDKGVGLKKILDAYQKSIF